MKILGIHGKKQSGKTTVAQIVAEELRRSEYHPPGEPGYPLLVWPLAKPLKDMASIFFGVPRDVFDKGGLKEMTDPLYKISYRQMLVDLSAQLKKKYGPHCWLRLLEQEVTYMGLYRYLLIPDVRFEIEQDWIHARGGSILHIWRPGASDIPAADLSEAGLPLWEGDTLLENGDTLDKLESAVLHFVAEKFGPTI